MALITAEWSPLGKVFYRKTELYAFSSSWTNEVNLSRLKVSAAQYGGPIALLRDEKKLAGGSTLKPVITIYSSSGNLISQIRWNSGAILKIGWSSSEELFCVQEDGSVLVYDMFGCYQRIFTFGNDVKETKAIDCQIFQSSQGSGIAVLSGAFHFYIISSVDDPRLRRLADIPGFEKGPNAWTIISRDRQAQALISRGADLYLVEQGGQSLKQDPPVSFELNTWIDMSVSVNNKYLAMLSDSGILWIGPSDLQNVYCEYDTRMQRKPDQLAWCGTGAVVGVWNQVALVVGPSKDKIDYAFESPIHIVPEIDGLRIISNYTHEFLQKVPSAVEEIFKIGSMSPGAMLFEAAKEFQRKSQRADEYIRMIKDKLDKAVDECIDAAGQEFEPSQQKALLRAASFGKCFLIDMRPDSFVNMCQTLRVLNALRDSNIGIPLAIGQYHQLSLPVVLDRLVFRRHFCLAVRICEYLRLPETDGASRVLAHWACYKVQQKDVPDEKLARNIAVKLGDTPGISYSEIANKAIELGRVELAIQLLDFEPRAAEQVPLLLKMDNRERLALNKAIESGDTDLVYTVILRLKEKLPLADFLMAIRNNPDAYSLYLRYCRQQNSKLLQDLYYQEDNHLEEGYCRVRESFCEERLESRVTALNSAHECFIKAKNDFMIKATEEEIKLLKYQRRLEEELDKSYIDLSLHDTIKKLLKDDKNKLAEQLKKEFKVPDRHYWWLKANVLSEIGDWVELERFSKSKKSPIGYEPFVEACMKYRNRSEAEKYVQKVPPENRARCLVKIGLHDEAADCAFQQKNEDDLNYIMTKCGDNKAVLEKVKLFRMQMSKR